MATVLEDVTCRIGADITSFRTNLGEASALGSRFAYDLTRAFTDAALKGRSLANVLKQLAFTLSAHTLQAAVAPLTGALGNSLAGLLGAVGAVPVAKHAKGGVIASPIAFPLSAGRVGLAGEAGPEVPLARSRDGRLGVRSESTPQALNITFNVTAQDAQSFRRSEGQIAAMLSRAVGRGNRNL
jgi:phage-related minor tail protein